jgi:thioredoxin-related protein
MQHISKKLLFIICALTLVQTRLVAQNLFNEKGLKNYEINLLDSVQAAEAKPIVFYIFTDWCVYCRQMKKQTFQDANLIKILNKDFYFSQLNAESKKDFKFANQEFSFYPSSRNSGTNELAIALAAEEGQISYPALVVLNQENEIIYKEIGFQTSSQLKRALRFLLKEGSNQTSD